MVQIMFKFWEIFIIHGNLLGIDSATKLGVLKILNKIKREKASKIKLIDYLVTVHNSISMALVK